MRYVVRREIYMVQIWEKREKRGKRKKYIYIRVYIYIYFYLLSKQTFNWLFIIYTCVHIHTYILCIHIHTLYKHDGASCCINRVSLQVSSIASRFEEALRWARRTGTHRAIPRSWWIPRDSKCWSNVSNQVKSSRWE